MPSSATQAAPPARAFARTAKTDQRSSPRWFLPALLGICLVGAVLRWLLRAEYLADNPLAMHPRIDALTYWNWAGRIASGQLIDDLPFFSAPLYPYLLAGLRAAGGELPAVYTIQILLHLVTAGLLAWIARLRFGPAVGLLAAAIYLLMLEPASFCLRVLPSTLQLSLVCVTWLALLAVQRHASLARGIVTGAVIGLLALSYPPAMLYLPIFAAWWWWHDGHKPAGVLRAAICVLAGLAVISPATIHNYYASGELIPISGQAGITFAQGNAPGADGTYTPLPGVSSTRDAQNLDALRVYRRATGEPGSWNAVNRFFFRQGLAYWRDNPVRAVELLGIKAYWFLSGRNYGEIHQPTMERAEGLVPRFWLSPLHTAWLLPPALLAIAVWLRRFNHYLPELMLFGVPLLVVLLFFYSPRYRSPAIPVVVVAGAWALWQALQWRSRRVWSIAVGLALIVGAGLGFVNRTIGFDQLDPDRPRFRAVVGFAFMQANRLEEAAAWFRKALDADPEFASARGDLGAVLARLGRTDEALEHLRRAVRTEPRNPTFHDQLGRALVQQQRLDEAIQHFKTAVELNPNAVRLRNNLGNALLLKGEPAAAIDQYAAALQVDPEYADAHLNLGRALAAQNKPAEALRHLAEATRLDPDLIEAGVLSARILLGQGDVQGGIAALRKAHERAPQNDALANDLAWYLGTLPGLAKADRALAVTLARQAVRQGSEASPDRLDTLAAALAANGQFAEAVRTMERAISLAEQRGATETIGQFRQRLGLYKNGTPYVESPTPTTP
jgi:tetratricopeptide (TPR) repeat protein